MKLRAKTISLVVATLLISAAVLIYVASSITRESYGRLEQQSANRDLRRLEKVLLADFKSLFANLEDYAYWDETYDFVIDRHEDYIRSNFSRDTFSNPAIDIVIIVDRQGGKTLSTTFVDQENRAQEALDYLLDELQPDGDLYEEDPEEFGIIAIGSKILIIAMAPIFRSNGGGKSRGIMLVGRFLDAEWLSELQEKTQLDVSFQTFSDPSGFDDPKFNGEIKEFLRNPRINDKLSLANPAYLIQPMSESLLAGYMLMPDILGEPLWLWSVTIPRDIHLQGGKSLDFLLIAIGVVGVMVVGCVVLLLDRLVLRRLGRLSGELAKIGNTDDLTARVSSQGNDELGFLANSTNDMLGQLQISKDKLQAEHERAENLLLNILPAPIADRLKSAHQQIADSHEEVTVLFADLVGFTSLSARMTAADVVSMLNDIFSLFDDLAEELGLEKIKTIGDCYMVASGLPREREDHAEAIAEMALSMVAKIDEYSKVSGLPIKVRVGINTGQVVAGVIGKKKFIYDLWGDTVNIASRMESSSETGTIQTSEATYARIKHRFVLEKRGLIDIKGRGEMMVYVLQDRGRQSA